MTTSGLLFLGILVSSRCVPRAAARWPVTAFSQRLGASGEEAPEPSAFAYAPKTEVLPPPTEAERAEVFPLVACTVVMLALSVGVAASMKPAAKIEQETQLGQNPQDGQMESTPLVPSSVREVTRLRAWAVTFIVFSFGFMLSIQGLILNPLEAERLWPNNSSFGLGAMSAIFAIAQLVGPLAGQKSDHWRSSWGRRRPLIIICATCAVSSYSLLWLCSRLYFQTAFLVVYTLQQLFWAVLAATAQAIVPDLVPMELVGFAGGASAANCLAGAMAAFCTVGIFSSWDYHYFYAVTAAVLVVTCSITVYAADERPSLDHQDHREDVGSVGRLLEAYTLDVQKYPDYALLLVAKTLNCAAAVVKTFALFFVQDTFRMKEKANEETLLARLSITAEAFAALAALTAMWLLDGSKEKIQAISSKSMLACRGTLAMGVGSLWMGLLWLGPIYVGGRIAQAFPEGGEAAADSFDTSMLAGVGAWGLGQGLYLAGDQATAFTLVPDQEEAGRYLALNSITWAAGGALGGVLTAALITLASGTPLPGQSYGFSGYIALYMFACVVCMTMGGVAVKLWGRQSQVLADVASRQD